ncbi:MAG TPA: DNA-binding response regulator [Lachnospiraceae bacterium]|nr:DNA-binding response regulator [Lachnospiraceae bacterium]
MKLLIVDDEKLTRDGLMNSIDWERLGIDAVAQADDGLHGYELAGSFHPDIVLSDVRMPRMSGIEMAEKLQADCPDISIIFMSGYSDKEYLKAAIKLKAVSYVEKPIDLEEIKGAVRQACRDVEEARKAAGIKALSISMSRSALASRLAMAPRPDAPPVKWKEMEFQFPADNRTAFFTFLIQFYHLGDMPNSLENLITPYIAQVLDASGLKEIHGVRQGSLFFYHIWGFRKYSDKEKDRLGCRLEEVLKPLVMHYHIVFGKNVEGAGEIHNSYNSAVIELQNSFFSPENTHRIYEHRDNYDSFYDLGRLDMENRLGECLLHKSEEETSVLLEEMLNRLIEIKSILPNQAKDLYYKLFAVVRNTYRVMQIQTGSIEETDMGLWGSLSSCESIYELHKLLKERVASFFTEARGREEENSTIYLIKQFIADRYQDETLSVKDISEHVMLSSSYVCTLFKNDTGMTLNQYLTEYRIERAKKLLEDPRYKIIDISAKVGYSDGNYFGKIFKRVCGMSPSEYREKTIH